MAEYENLRMRTIEENKRKMKELRLKPLAYETMSLMNGMKKQKINNIMKSKQVFENDDEYTPEEDGHLEQSAEEDNSQRVQTIPNLRSCSKKVIASGGRNLVMSVEKPRFSNTSMASLVKTRSQTQKKLLQQRKDSKQQDVNSLQTKQQEKVLAPRAQQVHSEQNERVLSQAISHHNLGMASEKNFPKRSQQAIENDSHAENTTHVKKGQIKTMVAPGTLGVFLRMREKSYENERLSKQSDDFDKPMESSRKRQTNCSGVQLFEDENGRGFGLANGDEGARNLDDYVVEKEQDTNPINQNTNELMSIQDQQTDQLVSRKEKRTRGPNTCKDVHGWTLNDRKPIILNGMGQPIGPDDATLAKFSQFLGSLSRDSRLAPLNHVDWRHVPHKDKIWDYVKKKFLISEEGKDNVLSSVGALWRSYKTRTKKKHYARYDNEEDRWENRPRSIPDSHFADLLEYWNVDEVQEVSQKNKERSEQQKDRHTMGPISFARKHHELEQAENKAPSKSVMYKETRKRKEGRKYKTTYNEMEKVPESRKSGLLGRCTKKGKQHPKSGVLIPDEVLQPYETQIVKKTLGEVMKFLKDHIPSETLATIASSLNGQSFGDIDDAKQCQNDADVDDGANDDDDDGVLEGHEDRIENEEENYEDY